MNRVVKAASIFAAALSLAACSPSPSTTPSATDASPSAAPSTSAPPSSSASPSSGTTIVVVYPFDTEGNILPEYKVYDERDNGPLDCSGSGPSDQGITAGTHSCGGTSQNAFSCLESPTAAGELACVSADEPATLALYKATNVPDTAVPDEPTPLWIELTDGTKWAIHTASGYYPGPDGTYPMYSCTQDKCPSDESLALVQVDGQPLINENGDVWTIQQAQTGNDTDKLSGPTTVEIAKVWYIGTPSAF